MLAVILLRAMLAAAPASRLLQMRRRHFLHMLRHASRSAALAKKIITIIAFECYIVPSMQLYRARYKMPLKYRNCANISRNDVGLHLFSYLYFRPKRGCSLHIEPYEPLIYAATSPRSPSHGASSPSLVFGIQASKLLSEATPLDGQPLAKACVMTSTLEARRFTLVDDDRF